MRHTQTMAVESLSFREMRTYALSALFVTGNIVLPQLCHLMPGGGMTWLPIYFFTLIAAYRFGLAAGLVTAICSPIANNLAFGMPPATMLPIILVKSTLLAAAASAIASKTKKTALWAVSLTVLTYQALGSVAEWFMTGSPFAALQDLRLGWPGLLLQVFGGWTVLAWPQLKASLKKRFSKKSM